MGNAKGSRRSHLAPDEAEPDMPIINEFAQDLYADETPPDVDNFLTECGLADKRYRCTIKQYNEDGGAPVFLPGSWVGKYPSLPEIGSKFGPGRYRLVFSWNNPGPDGLRKKVAKEFEIILGDHWIDAHEEYLWQYQIRRKKRLESLRHKAETDKILYGKETTSEAVNEMEDLLGAKDKLQKLGVPVGMAGALTQDNNSMLPLIVNMQQESSKMMVTMMMENQKNMMQLFSILSQNNNGNTAFQQAMRETINMVTNVVDLKQALNPEKATMVDRIFEFMQTVAPQITQILAQPRNQARQDPMVKIAKDRPEVQAVMQDQAAMDALAQKLDAEYGIKQTNEILDVMGMQRSEALKEYLKRGGYQPEPRGPKAPREAGQEDIIDATEQETGPFPNALPDESEDLNDME